MTMRVLPWQAVLRKTIACCVSFDVSCIAPRQMSKLQLDQLGPSRLKMLHGIAFTVFLGESHLLGKDLPQDFEYVFLLQSYLNAAIGCQHGWS